MTLYLSNRDGVGGTSLTNEEGHYRFQTQSWTGNIVMGSGDELAVTQNSPLGMSVLIGTGDFKIDTAGYSYTGWNSASLVATISTANPSNPRKDAVVLYVDKAQNTPGTANNPGIIKHMVVAGTPAGSPVAPDDTAISTAVGASNPFIRLANVTVDTGVTQITNANISSTRVLAAPKLPANSVPSTALATNASWRVISITDVAGAASKTILWGYRQHVRITLERIGANATHILYCYLVDGSGSHSAFNGNVLRSRFGLNGSGTMVTDYASSVNAQVSLPSMTTYQAASGTLMYTGDDGANHMLLGTLGSENASIQTVHGSFWVSGGAVRGISVETSAGTLNSGRVIIEALEN